MTKKTIDEQLERLASAQERSATALEGILEAIASATVSVRMPETHDAGTNDEAAAQEAAEETEVEEAQEDVEPEPEPEPEDAEDAEEPAEDETSSEDGDEGDPLGDGEASEPYVLPEKLTNDTLRGFARDLMEKEGKAAVFEVLADVGKGYKAVGEVSKDDLKEAHEKMAERLKG